MGKITRYHPVSLHVVRGAAEYCGFKFGQVKQTKSDPTGLSATYHVTIEKIPDRVKNENIGGIRSALVNCFNADIRVGTVRQTSKGRLTATLQTFVFADPVQAQIEGIGE